MPIDRKTLLEQWGKSRAAMDNPDLPPELRKLAKRAHDTSSALLGVQDAIARKKALAEREETEAAAVRPAAALE